MMACDVGMFINRGRAVRHSLIPFLCDGDLIFGGHMRLLTNASFDIYVFSMFAKNVLKALNKTFSARQYHIDVVPSVFIIVVVAVGSTVIFVVVFLF